MMVTYGRHLEIITSMLVALYTHDNQGSDRTTLDLSHGTLSNGYNRHGYNRHGVELQPSKSNN